jgi:hypothetical protein
MTATLTTDAVRPIGEWFTDLSADVQADITEMVNENGYPLSDISDFIEQYGAQAYISGHYMTWCELNEEGYDSEIVEAYANEVGIDNIGNLSEVYVGHYGSEAEFAQEHFASQVEDVEALEAAGVVVDWQATWDTNLSYNYAYNNGYVFATNM